MDIDARIQRRRQQEHGSRLVQDYESVSPVAHIDEPTNRGPEFERLLDHLEPVFDGRLPPHAYVYGPAGAGKSAIVTALFTRLETLSTASQSVIYTSTRGGSPNAPRFVYVDSRETSSEFVFYHQVLDGLVKDPVPEHGISTDDVRDRIHDVLGTSRTGVVLGVDHVDSPEGADADELVALLANLPSNVSWLAVGRSTPGETGLTEYTATSIPVERYQRQMLVDVLMTRASMGLTRQALTHDLARSVATWADGNAHDALTALFVAADRTSRQERTRLTEQDVTAAIESIPRPSVSLGRVLVLPPNKQLVLRELVDLDADERRSVTATTETISARSSVDLSTGTVKRFLYEMAELGIVGRVQSATKNGKGRPPSRVELRFSPAAFRRLYDLQQ